MIILVLAVIYLLSSIVSDNLIGKPIDVLKQNDVVTLTKGDDGVYTNTIKMPSDKCITIEAVGAHPLQGTVDQVDFKEVTCPEEGGEE